MLTPEEIEGKVFKKSVGGINKKEVEDFLVCVKNDYEFLMKENAALRERVEMYESNMKRYADIEDTLKKAVEEVKNTAKNSELISEKKKEVLMESAEMESRKIIGEAQDRVKRINDKYNIMINKFDIFESKFREFLNSEMRALDEISGSKNAIEEYERRMELHNSSIEDIEDYNSEDVAKPLNDDIFYDSEDGIKDDIVNDIDYNRVEDEYALNENEEHTEG